METFVSIPLEDTSQQEKVVQGQLNVTEKKTYDGISAD